MRKIITLLYIATSLLIPFTLRGVTPSQIRWHNESTDTTKITKLLIQATDFSASNPNELMEFIGRQFVGMPYKSGTLEMEPETLTINLDEFDCTTFIETVTALALTIEDRKNSWQDFANNLESLRYRQGEANGYASRLHYFSDWIVTNTHRGYIKEVTDRIPQSDSQIKTLDYMSHNRASYPALKDSATFEGIKNMEVGYRSHRFPYIKSARLTSKPVTNALKGGDIVALTTKIGGLDVSHVGLIVIEKDGPHLLHASSREGKVVVDKLPLAEYMRKSSNLTGIRVIRLQTQ
ncbi:N-acetylmuramoyl-L-alanine amidase-like domain-containing protein [uncultured Duncaniella sp.]|uniref:N-acetylmuramoyl-L-alanine amidase-like domain-containing protein n=1 Tax=uncultured Duncaniella sp. TaxID=2768039 RepID=UPI0025B0F43D|nr:N-acetylmuramoyl-L-alanine amidase-like domain-containing protein [uncultured Duncaniella sp.]